LLEGRVLFGHFEGNAYADPVVARVLSKTTAKPYTGPAFNADDPYDAVVSVTLTDGRVLRAQVDRPLGRSNENPIPRAMLEAKFLDCAGRVLSPAASEKLCNLVMNIENLQSTRQLTALCEIKSDVRVLAAVAG
jgi:hypothetical protein